MRQIIVSKKIPSDEFENAVGEAFPTNQFQQIIFPIIHQLSGYALNVRKKFEWDLYKLTNGGIYLVPVIDQEIKAKTRYGMREISIDAFGLAVTKRAYVHPNVISESDLKQVAVDQYFKLQSYHAPHPEMSRILDVMYQITKSKKYKKS